MSLLPDIVDGELVIEPSTREEAVRFFYERLYPSQKSHVDGLMKEKGMTLIGAMEAIGIRITCIRGEWETYEQNPRGQRVRSRV